MIYGFTSANIKHDFPRAVLMTWWERYFIKATGPRLDRETKKKGPKCELLSCGGFCLKRG